MRLILAALSRTKRLLEVRTASLPRGERDAFVTIQEAATTGAQGIRPLLWKNVALCQWNHRALLMKRHFPLQMLRSAPASSGTLVIYV